MFASRLLKQFFHPALLQLLKFQVTGTLRRFVSSFRSRRKLLLSILGVGLCVVWLGQTVLAILFREPADPAQLRTWLSVSMLLYCLFHFIKIGCRKPTEPFDWTEAEKQQLLTAPLTRAQLVTFRLINYFAATAAKSLCFAVVMLPDLHGVLAGYGGMFLGLTLIDLVRILLERIAWTAEKIGQRCWLMVRTTMIVPAVGLLTFAFIQMAWSPDFQSAIKSPNPMSIPQLFLAIIADLVAAPPLSWLMAPWFAVADTILATEYNLAFYLRSGSLYFAAFCLSSAVYFADRKGTEYLLQNELKKGFDPKAAKSENRIANKKRTRVPIGLGGAKAIFWHHALGAIHYRASLAMSLLIPTLLSCIPLLSGDTSTPTSLSIVGSVVFYSFLLLPAALMLDFRRDVKRLAMWKATPVKPILLTIGQLAVPVSLMSLFQLGVLGVSVVVGGHPGIMLLAWPLLIPLNVLIIGMENAIFLAHPYRRNQEGFEVFLRTILTFTGKGVLFALGLLVVLLWAMASISIGKLLGSASLGAVVFGFGMFLALVLMAWLAVSICSRLFQKLDVSLDLPAT
jgi:hypothetical protein